MMKEEFKQLIDEQIDKHYYEVERAYMACNDNIDKRKFTQAFFLQALMWATKVNEARATMDRYADELKRLNDKVKQATDLLDSLTRM